MCTCVYVQCCVAVRVQATSSCVTAVAFAPVCYNTIAALLHIQVL